MKESTTITFQISNLDRYERPSASLTLEGKVENLAEIHAAYAHFVETMIEATTKLKNK